MGFEQRDMVTRNEIWIYFNDDWMDFNGIHSMNNYYAYHAYTPIHQALNINLQWTVRQPLASYRKAFLPTLGHEEIIIRILPAQLVPWFIHWAYDQLSNRNSHQVFSRYPWPFVSSNFTGVYDTYKSWGPRLP